MCKALEEMKINRYFYFHHTIQKSLDFWGGVCQICIGRLGRIASDWRGEAVRATRNDMTSDLHEAVEHSCGPVLFGRHRRQFDDQAARDEIASERIGRLTAVVGL